MSRRPLFLSIGLFALMALAGCTAGEPDPPSLPPLPLVSPSVQPDATATAENRLPTTPGLKVQNVAFGRSHGRIEQAIQDLKAIHVWGKLTGHLYVVKVSSRPGLQDVPKDDHLADAYLRAYIDDDGQGAMCDVKFFPAALNQDLNNWKYAHSQGSYPDPPPTSRQYWASILGHELSHCYGHGRGEPFALGWEAKILALVREKL